MVLSVLSRVRTRYRRWRLLRSYQRAAALRAGLSIRYGMISYMIALEDLQDDGLVKIDDGTVEWHWPQ